MRFTRQPHALFESDACGKMAEDAGRMRLELWEAFRIFRLTIDPVQADQSNGSPLSQRALKAKIRVFSFVPHENRRYYNGNTNDAIRFVALSLARLASVLFLATCYWLLSALFH
ncbi:hypothetical protein L596_029896 [Steinernema carpocapsae]|uniref:Uncharacterized protein n=1 Tax=Steinernema carpocapsae TaxID=34508 RepID=A0A4U5LR45_STECR|nr:hypothetical protein L596_029896 [Steinernema carpocapsae]